MTWFKVCDGFWSHPKVMAAGEVHGHDAQALAIAAWTLVGSNRAAAEKGPAVSRAVLNQSLPCWPREAQERAAAFLVEVGLWLVTPTGWEFHDWYTYQPTPEALDERRAAGRERKRKHDEKRRESNAAGNAVTNASGNAFNNASGSGSGSLSDSDQNSDAREGRGNASLVRPVSAAEMLARVPRMPPAPSGRGQWASALFNAVAAHWRKRGVPCPDRAGRDPAHKVWGDLADYMMDRAVMRRWPDDAATREAKSAALVAAYYASKDPRTCTAEHSLDYLAARPGQYTGDRKAS